MSAYVKRMALAGVKPHHVVRHMLGLRHGCNGARAWRRLFSQHGAAAQVSILDDALAALRTDLSDKRQDSTAR
jgi:tRNA-dihydrouridine synthase A